MNENLKERLLEYNRLYRLGKPAVSDQAFDSLLEEFKSQVPDSEYQAFRDSLSDGSGGKVKHPWILGSLDKVKNNDEKSLASFFSKYLPGKTLNVSAKVDGISCRLHYENGKLVSASTRGDGSFGEDLTNKISFVKGVPLELKADDEILDIRGELVIKKQDFELLDYANPRNATAGIMNKKDWTEAEVSLVSFVCYTVLGDKYTKAEQFRLLKENGFETARQVTYIGNLSQTKNVSAWLERYLKEIQDGLDYGLDGLVLTPNEDKNQTGKYRPDNAVAFKLNELRAVSRLIDVEWQRPSKDGFVIPVAIVEPVELGGAVISRTTLHNLDFIEEMDLCYGSTVEILKAGDIIPQIVEANNDNGPVDDIAVPTVCPCCGGDLVKDGVNLRCLNPDCQDQKIWKIVFFLRKLGVEGAAFATIEKLGFTTVKDVLAFRPESKKKNQLKLEKEILEKVFTADADSLLKACNFEGLAEIQLGKILDYNGGFEQLLLGVKPGYPEGIGEKTMAKFTACLETALEDVKLVMSDCRYTGGLSGQTTLEAKGSFVVTGSLAYGSRQKFEADLKKAGWESKSAISKNVDYLVCNDKTSGSSKLVKAGKLGIKIVTEKEFLAIAGLSSEDTLDNL